MEPESVNQDLQSLLIMPVQRVPRYRLLLESLLKHTDADHADHVELKLAIEKINECATYQNAKIAETNRRMKVSQLSVKLKLPSLVQPHRRLVSEGELTIRSGKTEKLVKVYLFSDLLVIQKQGKLLKRTLVRQYPLVGAYVVPTPDESVLALMIEERQYTFVFGNSPAERVRRQQWLRDFETVLSALMRAPSTATLLTTPRSPGRLFTPRSTPVAGTRKRSRSFLSSFIARTGSSTLNKLLGHGRNSKSAHSLSTGDK